MAKKRANGEGSIKKRDNGTYEARYSYNGKRYSVYGKTQAEARRKLTEALSKIDNGLFIAPANITVGQWLEIWQRDYLGDVKPATVTRYSAAIRLYILPIIGEVKLCRLMPAMINKIYKEQQERGLSTDTLKSIRAVLFASMQQAVENKIISQNPVAGVKLPKSKREKEEMHPLVDEQIGQFLQAATGKKHRDLFFVAMFTGMRRNEILGLTWDCIDFTHGTIRLYRQLRPIKGGFEFAPLKNSTPRTFSPAADVMQTLKEIRKQQAEQRLKAGESWQDNNLVFAQADGRCLCGQAVYIQFKSIVESLGLPKVRFHDLRHTYATLALQNGVDPKTVSQILGHKKVAFTLDMYGHVSDTMQRTAADKMQAYIQSL